MAELYLYVVRIEAMAERTNLACDTRWPQIFVNNDHDIPYPFVFDDLGTLFKVNTSKIFSSSGGYSCRVIEVEVS